MMLTQPTRYLTKKCSSCETITSAMVTPEDFRAACLDDSEKPLAPGKVFRFRGMTALLCRGGCGKAKFAHAVRGKYSAKHPCNARCLTSTGPQCECSCGGKNHGANYAA